MKLSELKEMVDNAVEYFSDDYEVEIYGSDGAEFEPNDLVKVVSTNIVIFD